jgi:hypothetical protein
MALENTRLQELLPEQLRGTASNLIAFLDNYYTQENVSNAPSSLISLINENQDLDRVLDETFVESLAQTIAKNVSASVVTERTFLLKRLVDYYNLKGTSKSIIIFFQLFYNKIVEVEEPYLKVIVPSGSKYNQNRFLRIVTESGRDANDLKGTLISQQNEFGLVTGSGIVDRVSKEEYDEDIFTLHFDAGTASGSFFPGNKVYLNDVCYGKGYKTLKDIEIVSGGTRNQVGDILFIDEIGKNTFKAKVEAIGPIGEVLKFKILQRGSGNTLYNTSKLIDFKYNGQGFLKLRIQRGVEIVNPIGYDSPERRLIVNLHFDTLVVTAGYSEDDKSQLSADSVLQDGRFYDKFSYEIRSNITYDKYRDLFRQLIHPVGYNVFNDIKIETTPPVSFDERIGIVELKSLESEAFQPGGVYQFGDSPTPGTRLGDSPDTSRPDEKILTSLGESFFRDDYSFSQSPISIVTLNQITNSTEIADGSDYFMEDFLNSSPSQRQITISGLTSNYKNLVGAAQFWSDSPYNGIYLPGAHISPGLASPAGFTVNGQLKLVSTLGNLSPTKIPRRGKINGRYYWFKAADSPAGVDSSPEKGTAVIYWSSPSWILQGLSNIHATPFLSPMPLFKTLNFDSIGRGNDIPPTVGWTTGDSRLSPYASAPILTYNNIVDSYK